MYCKVDSTSLDENAYIVDKDSATITAEDSKAILTQAQQDLQAEATDYKPLLTLAQQQAQQLMEDYVKTLSPQPALMQSNTQLNGSIWTSKCPLDSWNRRNLRFLFVFAFPPIRILIAIQKRKFSAF